MSQRDVFRVIDFGDHYSIEKCKVDNGNVVGHTNSKSIFVVYKKEHMTDYQMQMRNHMNQISVCVNQPAIKAIKAVKEKINEKSTKDSVQSGKKRGSSSKK